MPSIKYSDLEMAMEFVSGGSFIDAHAYISRMTGEIHWESDDNDEEIPDDLGDPDLARPEIDHEVFTVREPAGHIITIFSSHMSGKPI